MILILWGWDTTIVGVDCMTWTRFALFSEGKISLKFCFNKNFIEINKIHLWRSFFPDSEKWHHLPCCSAVKDSILLHQVRVDYRWFRVVQSLECLLYWCLQTTSKTTRHCHSPAVYAGCPAASVSGDGFDVEGRRLDDRWLFKKTRLNYRKLLRIFKLTVRRAKLDCRDTIWLANKLQALWRRDQLNWTHNQPSTADNLQNQNSLQAPLSSQACNHHHLLQGQLTRMNHLVVFIHRR